MNGGRHSAPDDPVRELRRDRRREMSMLLRGLAALVVVAAVVIVHQRYFQ